METKQITIEPYIITYSNLLEFEGKKLAFRKRELFDVSVIPTLINRSDQGWWIGRKLLTPTKAKELIKNITFEVDITDLQWYQQEQLNHVFNL
jgi:hypothetical protein